MNLRLEQLAKRASLIALIVLVSAPTFNIKTIGENKMLNGATMITPTSDYSGGLIPMYQASGGLIPADSSSRYTAYQNANKLIDMPTNQPTGPSQSDIYAQQQAAAQAQAQQRARDSFVAGRDVMNTSINNSITGAAQGYQRGIIDKAGQFNAAQRGLDTKAINADMAKRQGQAGILNMVGQGIKSGGVMLANKNAGNSSGAQAIASAYGQLGQRQASSVNNQYGQVMNQIGADQAILNADKAEQMRRWAEDKTTTVNNIVADAERQIAALNEAAAGAGIAERMDIAAEANRIRSGALSQLQQFDSEMSKIQAAQSDEQRRSEAERLMSEGRVSDQSFNYSTEAPAQWQGTGPFASELPIFTYGRNRRQG